MRPIDLQQPLGGGDRRFRLTRLTQQRLGDVAGAVAQAFPFGGQPGIEGRVDAVQILQQIAVEQGQRGRLVGRGPHHFFDIDPDRAGTERQMIAGDLHDLGAGRGQGFQQPMNFLAQRGARLFLGPAAQSNSARRPRNAGRGAESATTASNARVSARQEARSRWLSSRLPSGRSAADVAPPVRRGWTAKLDRGPYRCACHHRVINTVSLVSRFG